MAGFEIIVRPVIFPNIRPQPARSLAPEDDPEKGVCVIKARAPKTVNITYSMSVSTSQDRPSESERRSDVARVYQKRANGTINKKNFVDIKVANRTRYRRGGVLRKGYWLPLFGTGGGGPAPPPAPNIELKDKDVIDKDESGGSGPGTGPG